MHKKLISALFMVCAGSYLVAADPQSDKMLALDQHAAQSALAQHVPSLRSLATKAFASQLASDDYVEHFAISPQEAVQELDGCPVLDDPHVKREIIIELLSKYKNQLAPITLERELVGHTGQIQRAVYNHDETRLASASVDGTVRIWNPATGEQVKLLEGHTRGINDIGWNHDGTRLASGSWDGTVHIWNTVTGALVHELEDNVKGVHAVVYSRDGSRLASGSVDGIVRIWNPVTGERINRLDGHTSFILSMDYNYDGTQLASGSMDQKVCIWNTRTGQRVYLFTAHTNWVKVVAYACEGMHLASGSMDGTVRIWNTGTGEQVRLLRNSPCVSALAYNHDGTYLASQSVIWNVATGKKINDFQGCCALSIVYNHDGVRLVSAFIDETIKLWLIPDYENTVLPLDLSQALYVLQQLRERNNQRSAQVSNSEEYIEDATQKNSQPYYERLKERVSSLLISLDRLHERSPFRFHNQQERERERYFKELHDSLPDAIKRVLDKKNTVEEDHA